MAAKKTLGSVKRYGVRYGRTTRANAARIEKEQRATHKCSLCSKVGVRRIAVGIWECRKCGVKFTGKAYTPVNPDRNLKKVTQSTAQYDFDKLKTKKKVRQKEMIIQDEENVIKQPTEEVKEDIKEEAEIASE